MLFLRYWTCGFSSRFNWHARFRYLAYFFQIASVTGATRRIHPLDFEGSSWVEESEELLQMRAADIRSQVVFLDGRQLTSKHDILAISKNKDAQNMREEHIFEFRGTVNFTIKNYRTTGYAGSAAAQPVSQ